MNINELLRTISDASVTKEERLQALSALAEKIRSGELKPDAQGDWVNNHIHTTYSFSPYTPSSAVFYAWKAGLKTAGIMDHDSVGGAEEFIRAGEIIGMPTTVGFECRVSVAGTALEGRRLNNPDQKSCAYLAMHGIPHQSIAAAEAVLAPLREKRNQRNTKMCGRITELVAPFGLSLDFENDVLPLSQYHEGGSVTERHVLFALVKKITAAYPDRAQALALVEKVTRAPLSEKNRDKLMNAPENFYEYDILGVLKSHMVEHFYVDADEECMHISEFTALQKKLGAISAYAYLGDVGESVTGDKKAQTFEDAFLDELFDVLESLHFCAVTYMPSRNTDAQLNRIMNLCDSHGFFQISGEDINSPRQSFICPALERPEFAHLTEATYALIGHESAGTKNIDDSMFADSVKEKFPSLAQRIAHFSAIGGYDK
ncbi:MAG: PHP domain-containing protein [Clostridia bacterium]|nr:PHP domain-containing protein [Clostridia bacterium]